MDEIELTQRMVEMDSQSGKSNLELAGFLAEYLEENGFRAELSEHDISGVRKANLYCVKEAESPGIILSGHMDTMPITEGWKQNPFSGTIDNGKLYGLGAADMKGPIAAMITAAKDACSLERSVEIALTFDEETDFEGVKRLIGSGALQGEHVIVGEPTGLKAVRASKGFAGLTVELYGTAGHSSNPKSCISAIGASQAFLQYLKSYFERLETNENNCFDPPYTTFNIGKIQGGTVVNQVPDYCRIELEFRHLPGQSAGMIAGGIAKILDALNEMGTCRKYGFSVSQSVDGFELEACDNVLEKARQITGAEPGTVSYCTEASYYATAGKKCIIIGPGSIEQAHKTDEYIEITQLQRGREFYRELIEQCCRRE